MQLCRNNPVKCKSGGAEEGEPGGGTGVEGGFGDGRESKVSDAFVNF